MRSEKRVESCGSGPYTRFMISEYVSKALKKAAYKQIKDGTWFGEIRGFRGVWANGPSIEHCRNELIEVLEEWLLLKIRDRDPIPLIGGSALRIKKVA